MSRRFTEFGENGGPAAKVFRPKFDHFRKHVTSYVGVKVPTVEVRTKIHTSKFNLDRYFCVFDLIIFISLPDETASSHYHCTKRHWRSHVHLKQSIWCTSTGWSSSISLVCLVAIFPLFSGSKSSFYFLLAAYPSSNIHSDYV